MRRFNEAEAHFERALKFNQQMSASPLEVKILYKCASMLRLRGLGSDRKRALAILHHALVTAAALKMKDLERRAQPILASVLRPRPTTSIAEHSGDTAAGTTRRAIASVLFTDVVGSTQHVTKVKDRTWAELLGRLHQAQRSTVAEFGGRHVNTAGDGMLALFNHPAEAIRCAFALSTGAAQLGLRIRSGIHTGECEFAAGYVAGIAVHIGARVVAQAGPEDVMVSSTVRDLLAGGEITFVDRGVTTLKGIPDEWRLYSVRGLGSDQC